MAGGAGATDRQVTSEGLRCGGIVLDLNQSDTGVPGGQAPERAARTWHPAPLRPYLIAAVVLCALYFLYGYLRYSHFQSPSWDLGIFEQEVRAYAGFDAPVVDIKGPGYLILGDHFSPVVALLVPLYWIWPSAVALLFAQAALFAGSAVIVGRTVQQMLGGRSGLCVTVAYGLSWGLQEAVKADFHEIALAVPLIALVCRALLMERWRAVVLWSLPLVLVKEDLGITVAVVGGLLALYGKRLQGFLLAAFGVLAFALTVLVLIPAASSAGTYDYWKKIEENGGQEVSPLDSVLGVLDSSVKLEMLVFLVGITAFMALRSPLILLVLPTLGWRLLSQDSNHWGMVWHYSAILMPVVFLAMADGIRRSQGSKRPWLVSYANVAVPVAAAVAVALTQHLPLRDLLRPETYRTDARTHAAEAALDAIPVGARVETDITLMAHLTADRTVYWIGGAPGTAPDVVAINLDFGWSRPIDDPVKYAEQLHPEARYRITREVGSFVVMERTTPAPGND
ncbi:DUF2079 domain-containing protein [Streptomyces sp. JAC25]|uniref:DUF2079 domain-containing protein n=1 Tax=unclassified Streptomyces TaxID=2593676 RepID=UPI0022762F25|nr:MULTISPECIES: DUF2079 domain-containing protein [unclassified Streptomyces]MCY1653247.1 DUF2079 domain-containing protein [Streptomyces sp. SL203]MCY1679515.1 DUF2079 domain-containing protein [Streptomyces sp. SL294]